MPNRDQMPSGVCIRPYRPHLPFSRILENSRKPFGHGSTRVSPAADRFCHLGVPSTHLKRCRLRPDRKSLGEFPARFFFGPWASLKNASPPTVTRYPSVSQPWYAPFRCGFAPSAPFGRSAHVFAVACPVAAVRRRRCFATARAPVITRSNSCSWYPLALTCNGFCSAVVPTLLHDFGR